MKLSDEKEIKENVNYKRLLRPVAYQECNYLLKVKYFLKTIPFYFTIAFVIFIFEWFAIHRPEELSVSYIAFSYIIFVLTAAFLIFLVFSFILWIRLYFVMKGAQTHMYKSYYTTPPKIGERIKAYIDYFALYMLKKRM